jgi:hypothetical protein
MVSLQHFNKDHISISRIFHIMGHGFGNIATVSGMVIKRSSVSLRGVYPDPSLPCYEEIPFVTTGMPVYLPQATRVYSDQCCRKGAGDWEDCGVNDLDAPPRGDMVVCFL